MVKPDLHFSCENCPAKNKTLFSNVCETHLKQISDTKHCIQYKKGQNIFYEGTKPMGIFCINQGNIKVFKSNSDGKEQIITLAKPGDWVGYKDLISEESYTSSATAIDDAIICFIPKNEFLTVIREDNELYVRIMRSVCKQLGIMEDRIAGLSLHNVRERLAATLLMLKESYGIDGNGSSLIDIALSREDLANIVGTATETVIRLLSEFKTEGYIELVGKKIKITNPHGLAKTASLT